MIVVGSFYINHSFNGWSSKIICITKTNLVINIFTLCDGDSSSGSQLRTCYFFPCTTIWRTFFWITNLSVKKEGKLSGVNFSPDLYRMQSLKYFLYLIHSHHTINVWSGKMHIFVASFQNCRLWFIFLEKTN